MYRDELTNPMDKAVDELYAEIDRLTAEVSRLQSLNEKMGNSFDHQISHRLNQIDKIEAENARLREEVGQLQLYKRTRNRSPRSPRRAG